jgi:peptidoglycan/xylan/chitin deacetylase (PgdA/CDA1 family)
MFYMVKTPWWLKKLYPNCIWQMPAKDKTIYLTFDDGPHPGITPFVLSELKKYGAKATFFCIGKNVVANPTTYRQVLDDGHAVGNHSYNHLNGWKTRDEEYIRNIDLAKNYIDSRLFRPPYGRATKFQMELLSSAKYDLAPVMWTVLSGDFDTKLTKEKCLQNVLTKATDGSIVLFHDSEKAFEKVQYVLPKVLAHYSQKGFKFERIDI